MAQYKVVIVDDDKKILALLKTYFERAEFTVITVTDGWAALQKISETKPDIIVLDLMLPGLDGIEICKRLRKESEVPILMLTARDEETDRLIGLEIGADDYVTKPFSPREVVARAKVILRRANKDQPKQAGIKIRNLVIDPVKYTVTVNNEPVELTATEFKILELLAASPGRVYSRQQIIERIQGYAFEGFERTIDAHIKNLRRKISDNQREEKLLHTVYGIGYKFAGDDHE